ncbi:MAG: hypothetical protein ABSA26_04425 [Thermoguttaceae bacterium]|jgi:hypothetical protein
MNRTVTNSAAGAALLLLFFAGCGTSDYEQRLDKRIKELKTGSKFNLLSSPIDVPGTQVSICVPQKNDSNKQAYENLLTGGFEIPPLQEGAAVDGKPIDSRRVKPNVIDINDLKLTFEGFIPDANKGKQPYYLYVAVSTGPNRVNYSRNLQAELGSKINDATQLADYKAQTPEGRSLDWQECQATGNQQFYYFKSNGEGQPVQLSGIIEMFFHEENDTLVTLIWRWPVGLEKIIDFKSWMDMTAGCVKVKSQTPAPGGE